MSRGTRRLMHRALHGLAVVALLSIACSPPMRTVHTPPTGQFLQDGPVTREGLEKEFGLPSATFEDERVWVWDLDGKKRPLTAPGEKPTKSARLAEYQLVVVFDDRGIVERHSLLRIR